MNQVGFKIHINEDVLVRGVSFGLEANKRPMNALGGVSSIRGSDWKDCSYESSWPGAVGIAVSWESDKEKDLIWHLSVDFWETEVSRQILLSSNKNTILAMRLKHMLHCTLHIIPQHEVWWWWRYGHWVTWKCREILKENLMQSARNQWPSIMLSPNVKPKLHRNSFKTRTSMSWFAAALQKG